MNPSPAPPGRLRKEPGGEPPIDLIRTEDALVLVISLPGLRATDFRITLVGNRQVQIDGTYPARREWGLGEPAVAEGPAGPFSRTVNLPLPVTTAGSSVVYERGVLTARLPVERQQLLPAWEEPEENERAEPR